MMDEINKSSRGMEPDKEKEHDRRKEMELQGPNAIGAEEALDGDGGNGKEITCSAASNHEVSKKEKAKKKKDELQRLLVEKEEELKQKHDSLLRSQAELENYKKRVAREKADLLKFGNESLVRELLPVIDNLERSLAHARDVKSIDTIIDGIDLIKKDFLVKMEKFGLRVIAAEGEKFDPLKHEAASQVETSEHPEDTIIEELQKGYFIHDRLLRPAMVIVATSPSTPQDHSPASDRQ
jgi:molecular chaperone GrpE